MFPLDGFEMLQKMPCLNHRYFSFPSKPSSFKAKAVFLLSVFFLLTAFPGGVRAGNFKKNTVVMGTELEMTVSAHDEPSAKKAFEAAEKEMVRIENLMSEWREDSVISKVNRNSGKMAVKVPDELFKGIASSIEVSRLSGGAFDISWASMRGIWNFTDGKNRVPSSDEIKQKLALVNYKNIGIDPANRTVFLKKKGMAIGLGAIAKGYAVDMAMKAALSTGIKDAIIRAGGDMRVQGTDNGSPWEIGIRHPRDKDRLLARMRLGNISISTSGDYERYFIKNGTIYHHIIDPKTGYPAGLCQSVTVLAPDTMTSDALSTAVFVLGPEKGMELVKSLNGIEAIIVDREGRVHLSAGMDKTGGIKN